MSKNKIIPPIDHLQEAAKSIKSDSNPTSIEDKLRRFIQHYDILNYEIKSEVLWRARKAPSRNGYSNKKDIYYPPPQLTEHGRLNEANHPILYLSFNQFTTLTEVNAKKGENIHIVGYSLKHNQTIRALILGEYFYAHKGGQGNLPGNLNEWINKRLNSMNYEPGLSFVYMDAFLSSLLTDKTASENEYLHTRILAKVLFEKHPKINAIHYPSVVSHGAMNLAIKPEVADEALKVKGTSVLHIDDIFDHGLFRFSLVKNAKDYKQNGKILWECTE